MKQFIFLFSCVMLFSCTNQPTAQKPLVAVSIVPQQYFVESIADTLVEVLVLVEPGASPELYELRPAQMANLAKASAWLGIGKIDFEQGWKKKILTSNPDLKFFDTSAQADWIAEEIRVHGDHVHMHGVDPHIWTSTKEGLKIAEETCKALCELLPQHKAQFTVNYQQLASEISQLDQELEQLFAASKNKSFLIFHPSLSYLTRDYGLTQIPLEFEGKEPSPKYIADFVAQAQNLNLTQILIQKEFSKNTAEQLAKEINGELVEINPLGEDWAAELRKIAQIITAEVQ
ncbi:MAG: metal ABC transporter solute-binding protein, Zn/Mn family [Mangrovibacterium sp.]